MHVEVEQSQPTSIEHSELHPSRASVFKSSHSSGSIISPSPQTAFKVETSRFGAREIVLVIPAKLNEETFEISP